MHEPREPTTGKISWLERQNRRLNARLAVAKEAFRMILDADALADWPMATAWEERYGEAVRAMVGEKEVG